MKHITAEQIKEGLKIVIFDFYGKYRILEFLCFEPGTRKRYAFFMDLYKKVERLHLETIIMDYNAYVFDGNYETLTRKQITIWQTRIGEALNDLKKKETK